MENSLKIPGLGAHESPYDKRTWKHPLDMGVPLNNGGVIYNPEDIENQHIVGICTAISLVQNAQKALGKKFSPDFQYLLQKKFVDGNWDEGSSIFSALKVGKNFGFLPIELFPYITEADRTLTYYTYISKLQTIPDEEIARLLTLCTDKLAGYAQLPTDVASLQRGILDSKSGILCRYEVGREWWTPSWRKEDIDPLRPPASVVSGHAIGKSHFTQNLFTLPNTWGPDWDDNGNAHIDSTNYQCTEAWVPYYDSIPRFQFKNNLWFGLTSEEVRQLQIRLNVSPTTGFFGVKTLAAVIQYQRSNGITPTGFLGPITRAKLNS